VPLLVNRLGQVPRAVRPLNGRLRRPAGGGTGRHSQRREPPPGGAAASPGAVSRAGRHRGLLALGPAPSQNALCGLCLLLDLLTCQLRDAGARLRERLVSLSHSLRSAPPPAVLGEMGQGPDPDNAQGDHRSARDRRQVTRARLDRARPEKGRLAMEFSVGLGGIEPPTSALSVLDRGLLDKLSPALTCLIVTLRATRRGSVPLRLGTVWARPPSRPCRSDLCCYSGSNSANTDPSGVT